MQGILSRTPIFEAFVLAPVTDKKVAKTDTNFLLMGLKTLVCKMAFLVIIVIGGLVQVSIFPTR